MKKSLLILLLLFSILTSKAQNWGGGIDQEDFNWGFSFQYVSSELKITKSPTWRSVFLDYEQGGKVITDPLNSVSSPKSVGFGIGFVLNKKINKHFDLRSTPSLVFADRLVNYKYEEPSVNANFSEKQQKLEPTIVDFPLTLKLKSDRRKDFRAYMLLGVKHSIDLASGKKNRDDDFALIEKQLKNKKSYSSYEAGIGFDLYFEYFKMSPEIKMSQSFKNVLKHENHPYATPIDKALLRNFTFSLFFE